MSREESEDLMAKSADGVFVVRGSSQPQPGHRFTLSVRYNAMVKHIKIVELAVRSRTYPPLFWRRPARAKTLYHWASTYPPFFFSP